ncbi:uncharacterized protein PV09_06216 [Verruconis gallopava]|uniref:Uncharacterized protein n=1 Tax=Verruconis gallopava TaxID=253628 RepID=A0A0D1XJC0_9PEZI|nr:uncharacterized protein PV09_06216 [Verruconis gallopava]KIW02396.1 hypothetical protein PV09_06216 [Verruconis gallopava]
MSRLQDGSTPRPLSSISFHLNHRKAAKASHTIQSAPAYAQYRHLDGATVASTSSFSPQSPHAATKVSYVGSCGGTVTEFPRASLPFSLKLPSSSPQAQSQATDNWVKNNESTPLARCMTPRNQQGAVGMCDWCKAAHIVKALEQTMASDYAKSPPLPDDGEKEHFAGLPQARSNRRVASQP